MPEVTMPKYAANSRILMTFFSISASGSESPTVAIMNAKDVPIATPFSTSVYTTDTAPAALE